MNNGVEKSFFIVKPCAVPYWEEIKRMIENELTLECYIKDELSNDFMQNLYNNPTNEFIQANITYIVNKPIVAGVVSGYNAVDKLMDLCGRTFISEECDKNTIRYIFRPSKPVDNIIVKGEKFMPNAIHRSDKENASREVDLFLTMRKDKLHHCAK